MAYAHAILKNYRQSPRKVRLVASFVKNKPVERAMAELELLNKRAATPIKKLLASAVANAKNMDIDEKTLVVKNIAVDKGIVLMRRRSRARGRAFPIRKAMSTVHVVVEGESFAPVAEKKATKKVTKTEALKPTVKKTVKTDSAKKTKAEKTETKAVKKTVKKAATKKAAKKE